MTSMNSGIIEAHALFYLAFKPRRSSSGSTVASRPRKSRNSCSASALPPRDSNLLRNQSPFLRVRPPFSLNQLTDSASSFSDIDVLAQTIPAVMAL